jgi:TolA-binding protein
MVRRLFSSVCFSLLVFMAAGGLLVSGAPAARAQAPNPAAALSAQGGGLFDLGRYKDAAAVYEQLLKAYPNSEVASEAQLRLAYCQFFLGQHQQSIDLLRKLQSTPSTGPELLELAGLLLPQVLAQQGTALPETDPKRKTAFEAAIKEYGAFIQKFPKSAELDNAYYGRAISAYQIGRFDDAARDLRENIAAFPRNESIQDSMFLLAITVGSQANLIMSDPSKAASGAAAAIKNYEEARKLLNDIIARKTDLSLANDAQFQLGQTLMAQAGATPEAARAPLFNAALAAFRAVEPKEPMIATQTARVARLREARIAEARKLAAANRDLMRRYDSQLTREQGKLATLQGKDDPVLTARLQCGAVFYQLQRFDETRVLMNALAPVATRPDDEKTVLYYTAMSYAGQKAIDKAVAAYDKFQAKYSGDPIAENLPLIIGNLFQTGDNPDAERANKYFAEFSKLYPKSGLRDLVMLQQANASLSLKKYDEALGTLDKFIKTKPKRELLATAELTRAIALQAKGDLNGALAAFKGVRDAYADRPDAEDASFRVGLTAMQKNDAPGALAELKTFLDKYPQSRLAPAALLTRAQAQLTTNAKDQAMATLLEVVNRFPDTPEAANAYFQRANVFITDKKFDDVVKTLSEFVDKYPSDPQVFAAYDRIAAVQAQNKQWEAAAATYQKFVDKQPDSPSAPEALSKVAGIWRAAVREMGPYTVLEATKREGWAQAVNKSIAASERQLEAYPKAPSTALGLQNLLECQRMLMTEAKLKTDAQVAEYFQKLAAKYKDEPAASSRIIFRLASLTKEKDPAKALADMKAAYDPAIVFSPSDMDQYSQALLAANDAEGADKVFQKLAADYPIPAGLQPAQTSPEVQEAQAIALYGRGKIAELKKDQEGAARAYETLLKTYPRSSKSAEAHLGIAQNLVAKGKPDEALPHLRTVATAPGSPLETRAKGMMLNAKIQQDKGDIGALDTYLKIAAFFPSSPQAPEGLWTGAQLLEKQAATLSDVPAKPGAPTKGVQIAKARKAYETLASKYPDSQWAAQAKQRLSSLPGAAPGK